MQPAPVSKSRTASRPAVALRAARALVGAAGWAAPALTARALLRLFFRRRPLAVSPASAAVLARAACSTRLIEGRSFVTYTWAGAGPEAPTALLVHGWAGRAAQMTAFVSPLLELGFRVVAFDHVGHGASAPGDSDVPTLARVVTDFLGAEPVELVVAHSAGALATSYAMTARRDGTPRCLVSPAASLRAFADAFLATLAVPSAVRLPFLADLERRAHGDLDAFTLERLVAASASPTLIVHDENDRLVPLREVARAAPPTSGFRWLRTRGLGHNRTLEDTDVVAAVAAFAATACAARTLDAEATAA